MKLIRKIFTIFMVLTIGLGSVTVFAEIVHFPPKGSGNLHTYTIWDKINWGYESKALKDFGNARSAINDSYGIVTYGNFFAGAVTSTFGKVGDLLIVVEEDGIIYPVIVQDIKNQNDYNCNIWGHYYGGCIVEFQILNCMKNFLYRGSGSYINEYINKPIYKIINIGSVYDNEKYLYNAREMCIDYGFSGYYMLTSPYNGEILQTVLKQEEEKEKYENEGESNLIREKVPWGDRYIRKDRLGWVGYDFFKTNENKIWKEITWWQKKNCMSANFG